MKILAIHVIQRKALKVMGEFTFPEFRKRLAKSEGWNSRCEASVLDEVNQVVDKLGGVKSIEQSYCNQEISTNNQPDQIQQRTRFSSLGIFSSFQRNSFTPRGTSISETVASKELTGDTNLSQQFGKSAPSK